MTPITVLLTILALFSNPDASVFPVLKIAQGVRAAGMGEAGIGLANDGNALYWNAAGLASFSDYSISLSHQEWFSDTKDELFQTILPAKTGALGFGVLYSQTGSIEHWDADNNPYNTFSTWNGVLSLGYGLNMFSNYAIGFVVKGCYENLYQSHGYGAGIDLGFRGQPLKSLGVGIACRNLGLMDYNGIYSLPAEVGAGFSYSRKNLTVVLDGIFSFAQNFNFRLGVEYSPVKELSLRVGYRSGPEDISSLGYLSAISAGLGVNLNNFSIDYALTPYGKLGQVHRLGLRLTLERKGQGVLRVRVFDEETTEPVWATITISGVKQFRGETGRKGELLIQGILPGQIVINTIANGYLPRTDTMLILGDREQSAALTLRPIKYGTITGTLYDATTSKPISGVVVYQGGVYGETQTDPTIGTFAIRNIPAGKYIITAQGLENYFAQTCTLELQGGKLLHHDFYLLKRQKTTPPIPNNGLQRE